MLTVNESLVSSPLSKGFLTWLQDVCFSVSSGRIVTALLEAGRWNLLFQVSGKLMSVRLFRTCLSAYPEAFYLFVLSFLHFPADPAYPSAVGKDEDTAEKGENRMRKQGLAKPPAAQGNDGKRTEKNQKRHD